MLNLQAIEKQAVGQVWSVGHRWLISDLELRPQILNLHLLFLRQENSSFHLPSVVGLISRSMKPSCSPDKARTSFTPAICLYSVLVTSLSSHSSYFKGCLFSF